MRRERGDPRIRSLGCSVVELSGSSSAAQRPAAQLALTQPGSFSAASLGLRFLFKCDTLCIGGGGRFCSWARGRHWPFPRRSSEMISRASQSRGRGGGGCCCLPLLPAASRVASWARSAPCRGRGRGGGRKLMVASARAFSCTYSKPTDTHRYTHCLLGRQNLPAPDPRAARPSDHIKVKSASHVRKMRLIPPEECNG